MFDVQQTNGSIRFADEQNPNIIARIMFEARRNSGLTKQLQDLASDASRFGPILNDEAAMTLHTCFRLSEDAARIPQDAAAWMIHQASVAPEINAEMEGPVKHLASFVAAYGDDPHVELLVKAGWSEETGGVIYGGLSVPNEPGLIDAWAAAYTSADIPRSAKEIISVSELDGRALLTVVVPEGAIRDMREHTGLQISHIFVTHEGSRLWFAAGQENAVQALHRSIQKCNAGALATKAPLFTARVDVERWLAYPQDEPTGVAGFLTWADENSLVFPPSPMSAAMMFGRRNVKPVPLLQKCIEMGEARTLSLL